MKRTLLAIAIGAISAGLAGGALAQDDVEQENGMAEDAAVGEEQATMEHEENGDPMAGEADDLDAPDDIEDHDHDPMDTDARLDDSLRDMEVSEIEGMTVVNQQDEEIGDVQEVVRHDDSGDLYVVVTVGGLWGMGGDDVVLPLSEMILEDDQLVFQQPWDEDELEEQAQEYDEDSYSEVDDDQTLDDAWGS
ncbi:PRC-barrel domain-containing protein [Billgrantia kenyensis]|uniref:PRC-barrel domain-containing protein n=1 Tax=Billgrantia kenyensis TaxID=321266 RepID=A0A7V9W387_9GAMM|nr:PRC-barrel domain-containing protein [Halomonas kenyensis]MBA2780272.1 PRC-barrel domain-containing protein [Halomonas kenyensis]MCG6663188.1 hypothetical protein [Halomonas kenyensis]